MYVQDAAFVRGLGYEGMKYYFIIRKWTLYNAGVYYLELVRTCVCVSANCKRTSRRSVMMIFRYFWYEFERYRSKYSYNTNGALELKERYLTNM